ncbi:hypothetical protein [Nonomuraea aurantiaca]|uniref:hypothetical protein n=1 Tax=Nonomuraea aurantiaca TaxID=2878562 RepID=UPI001CDA08C5|nr:hypothetical protein [Nonomuraea aurantiaca]MCA2225863.1 hypothetical protein [Nonomuraea aurantiaca]
MVRHGWIVAGALAFAGASVLTGIQCEPVAAEVFRAAGGAGIALVFERLGNAGEIGRWARTGDVLRFRVSLEGMGRDARLAVATSPAPALTSMTCPSLPAGGLFDASPGVVGGPGDQAVEGRAVPGGSTSSGGPAVPDGLASPGGSAVAGGLAVPGGQASARGLALPGGGLAVLGGQSVGGVHASGGALAARTAALNALAAGEAADGQASVGGRLVAGVAASRGVLASGQSSALAASLRTALVPTSPAVSASGVAAQGVAAQGVAASGGMRPGGGVVPGVVPEARVCALGDAAGDRSVDVLLTVPGGSKEVVLTAAARARDTAGGGFETVVGSATTSVKAPVSAPVQVSGRPAAPVATVPMGPTAPVATLPKGTQTPAQTLSQGTKRPAHTLSQGTKRPAQSLSQGTKRPAQALSKGAKPSTQTLPKATGGEGAVRGQSADDSAGTFVEIPRGDVTLSGRAVRVKRGAENARPDGTAVAGSVRSRNGHTAKSDLRMVAAGHARASSTVPNGTAVQVPAPGLRREPALTLPQVLPPPTSGLGTPRVGGAPQGGAPAGGTPGLGTPGFGAGAGTGWGAMTSAEEVGPPLPFAIPGNRYQPAERVNPLAGVRGLPWVAGGIAVLLGGLWLVARAQRARLRRKVL